MEITQDYSVELLDKYFATAFAAPDGIKRLRELILTLAMRGQLVPQDPNEQTASELLREIATEKKRLIKQKKIKKSKPLPEITPDEIPYDLPNSWEWVRLGNIIHDSIGGGTPSKNNISFWNGNIPWASVKDLNVDVFLEKTIDLITEEGLRKSSSNLVPENTIIVCTRMGLGKIVINKIPVAINQDLRALILSPCIDKMFFFQKYKNYNIQGTGVTVKGIRLYELINLLFPLPPLEEQQRIVEKIDRLMEQVDRLEKLQAERDRKRLIIHTAASDRLLNAPAQKNFNEAWSFIQENFNELYLVKENISELRKAILQLAVMGKLVPQDPNDPPASELLKEIKMEKQRLIKEKKIKKQKPLSEIKPEEIPYDLPESWTYARIDELFIVTGGIQKTSKRIPIKNHYPYLGVANVQRGYLNLDVVKRFELIDGELDKYSLQSCDLLVVEGNGSANEIGRCAIWQDEIEFCVHQNHLIRCRPLNKNISNYILMVLNSPFGINEMKKLAVTTSGLYSLSVSKIRGIHLLVPPLPEQNRIVAKVDLLMALCDQLEEQSIKRTEKQSKLLDAVLAKI